MGQGQASVRGAVQGAVRVVQQEPSVHITDKDGKMAPSHASKAGERDWSKRCSLRAPRSTTLSVSSLLIDAKVDENRAKYNGCTALS